MSIFMLINNMVRYSNTNLQTDAMHSYYFMNYSTYTKLLPYDLKSIQLYEKNIFQINAFKNSTMWLQIYRFYSTASQNFKITILKKYTNLFAF